MRVSMLLGLATLATLAACTNEAPENVQQRAEDTSEQLEQRAGEIEAQAGNAVGADAMTLENQQKALELEAPAAEEAPGNQADATGNAN